MNIINFAAGDDFLFSLLITVSFVFRRLYCISIAVLLTVAKFIHSVASASHGYTLVY